MERRFPEKKVHLVTQKDLNPANRALTEPMVWSDGSYAVSTRQNPKIVHLARPIPETKLTNPGGDLPPIAS